MSHHSPLFNGSHFPQELVRRLRTSNIFKHRVVVHCWMVLAVRPLRLEVPLPAWQYGNSRKSTINTMAQTMTTPVTGARRSNLQPARFGPSHNAPFNILSQPPTIPSHSLRHSAHFPVHFVALRFRHLHSLPHNFCTGSHAYSLNLLISRQMPRSI